jgi:hypothetical protein
MTLCHLLIGELGFGDHLIANSDLFCTFYIFVVLCFSFLYYRCLICVYTSTILSDTSTQNGAQLQN